MGSFNFFLNRGDRLSPPPHIPFMGYVSLIQSTIKGKRGNNHRQPFRLPVTPEVLGKCTRKHHWSFGQVTRLGCGLGFPSASWVSLCSSILVSLVSEGGSFWNFSSLFATMCGLVSWSCFVVRGPTCSQEDLFLSCVCFLSSSLWTGPSVCPSGSHSPWWWLKKGIISPSFFSNLCLL